MKNLRVAAKGVDPGVLKKAEIFRELDDAELMNLGQWFAELEVPADYDIIQQGEKSEAFYVVQEGAVAIFSDAVGAPVQLLARLGPGEFFGEMGLFGTGQQTATVRSVEKSRLFKISKRDLLAFLSRQPAINRKLQAAASYRYAGHMAATLELARRREVRIRFDRPVDLRLEDGSRLSTLLLNLSLGGMSLEGVPEDWLPDTLVRFRMCVTHGELELAGRITWRRDQRVGMAFVETHRNHNMLIQLTIRLLLETSR